MKLSFRLWKITRGRIIYVFIRKLALRNNMLHSLVLGSLALNIETGRSRPSLCYGV